QAAKPMGLRSARRRSIRGERIGPAARMSPCARVRPEDLPDWHRPAGRGGEDYGPEPAGILTVVSTRMTSSSGSWIFTPAAERLLGRGFSIAGAGRCGVAGWTRHWGGTPAVAPEPPPPSIAAAKRSEAAA